MKTRQIRNSVAILTFLYLVIFKVLAYYWAFLSVRNSLLRLLALSLFAATLYVSAVAPAFGQETSKTEKTTTADTQTSAAAEKTEKPVTFIHLVGGGKLQVEEARETRDGVWYTNGGVTALIDAKRVVRIETPSSNEAAQREAVKTQESNWRISDWTRVQAFFVTKFGRPLPVSTFGQSALHNRWGLDHRQGIDVGLHPDSGEGSALLDFLRSEGIPFLAFRGPVPRVSTGPHIHIGRPSPRSLLR